MKTQAYILILCTLLLVLGCSSEGSDVAGDNKNPLTSIVEPKLDPPTNLYIVNMGFTEKGLSRERATRITKDKKVTLRGNDNYSGIIGDKKLIHLFGANFNIDNSVPLKEDEQPEAHSRHSIRNNLTASFIFSNIDDPNANMIFVL